MENPLLQGSDLPHFSQIKPEHVVPAIEKLLSESRTAIENLIENPITRWEQLIPGLEDIQDRLQRAWSPVSHMNSVVNSDALRDAYTQCLPLLSEYHSELGQNTRLYQAYKSIAESKGYADLNTAQKTVIRHALRDFHLSGVDLPEKDKTRFREINQRLSNLTSTFSDNVLDATQAWTKQISDETQLAGLPPSSLALTKQTAEQKNLDGWLITLDFPSYYAVMSFADNRELRKEVHDAYVTRASELGPNGGQWDNSQIMVEILELRQEKSKILGFTNYAEYSLATKMANDTTQVLEFLQDLAKRSKPLAKTELEELKSFAKETAGIEELKPWDFTYFGEKLRQRKYAISQEELKPYFPEHRIVNGMFTIVQKLYGITITEQTNVDKWHKDVRFFEIRDKQNTVRGKFFLDLYARAKKRGGAWMDVCVSRRKTGNKTQTPVAYLTCNFSPPVGEDPALFTHQEVTTLFHEFGHGLHHMLTKIDYMDVSGISGVEWDAVELPSQFMENWCWDKAALAMMARHYISEESLPNELYKKMLAAKNFQAGMIMLRQLEFSLFDFRLHMEFKTGTSQDIQQLLNSVRDQVAVVSVADYNRFQHSFSHIFAGGYAAGYFSYKWAEVLSADAFSKFEETDIFSAQTGEAFLTEILEKGGSQNALELFVAFRGREPSIDALLRHNGIGAS